MLLILFASTLASSFLLTAAMRRYAIARQLMDVPTARSSHEIPTPRGGGVSIVASVLVAIGYLVYEDLLGFSEGAAFFGGGLIAAGVGFWDDHGHVPPRWRLLGHLAAAIWGLYWLGGVPPIVLWDAPLDLGWLGSLAALFVLVWLLNLYNFMDGINGIASIEAITVVFSAICIFWNVTGVIEQPVLVAILGAVSGFVIWNFPRARIFMGDACSGFLGFLLGLVALWQAMVVPELFVSWMILLGCFLTDATVTLGRRVLRGEKFYEAHRSHAYQVASRRFGSHTPVSIGVGAINVFWLFPIALVVAQDLAPAGVGFVLAYTPLILLVLYFQFGNNDIKPIV